MPYAPRRRRTARVTSARQRTLRRSRLGRQGRAAARKNPHHHRPPVRNTIRYGPGGDQAEEGPTQYPVPKDLRRREVLVTTTDGILVYAARAEDFTPTAANALRLYGPRFLWARLPRADFAIRGSTVELHRALEGGRIVYRYRYKKGRTVLLVTRA